MHHDPQARQPIPAAASGNGLADGDVHVVRTSGSYNCGGRCIIEAHVRDGRVVRITSDESGPDTLEQPQLRGCLKCRGFRAMLDRPDRLTQPLKRIGRRGEGRFEPISWDEALDTIAAGLARIRETYGPDAIYVNYATGNSGLLTEKAWMRRLLGLTGGFLGYYGNYSSGCTTIATPYTYGTSQTGSSRSDWVNARLIILAGWNPADTTFGTNTTWYLKRAKEAGARIIAIDPICTNSAVALADQWIPIRPTTDNALFDAMAWVMITENLHDQAFLDRFCIGFDEEHMPAGIPFGHSYRSHILGLGPDGRAKTPAWAEAITGIPEATIVELARAYATCKPGALIQGHGPQRHANGEQAARGGTILAAMTGNVGISGGWAAGKGAPARQHAVATIPAANPNRAQISHFCWPDAIRRGREMGAADGLRGADRLRSDIKLIFNLGGNCLVNQHSDINGITQLLADESKVELIVASELFMTASARFADIVLPSDNMYERDNIALPWQHGDEFLFMNRVVEPPDGCRNGFDWVGDLAGRLGVRDRFTEGRTLDGWLRWIVSETARLNPGFPDYETLRRDGVHRWLDEPFIAFRDQITDPGRHPFPTPSGKIEIFSQRLWDMDNPAGIPAVPQHVAVWEGPEDPLRQRLPLQCIGPHSKRRVHSSFDNSEWMTEAEPQALWISPADAAIRGISNGCMARVFNDRGATVLPAKVTPRIMPGVVAIPQGAWWQPDGDGVDRNGSINVLTRHQPTPLAFSNPSHTCLVDVMAEAGPAVPAAPDPGKSTSATPRLPANARPDSPSTAATVRPAAAKTTLAVPGVTAVSGVTAMSADLQRAFHFDQRYCTGCQACQIACKDKNNLPAGIRWRRVDEFACAVGSAGSAASRDVASSEGPDTAGSAAVPGVRAWWLSLSCNHCQRPACIPACATGAIVKRPEDGVVLIDPDRCIGCRRCLAACPYGAISFDTASCKAGKCDFCHDRLANGKAPACVSACPMRVLDHGTLGALTSRLGPGDTIPGLPDPSITAPALIITGHAHAIACKEEAIACQAHAIACQEETIAHDMARP